MTEQHLSETPESVLKKSRMMDARFTNIYLTSSKPCLVPHHSLERLLH
ncbi:MAG: hypothetical protein ABSC53_15295 [Bacteroidota bacterium]